jgi:hypothetical protein
VILCVEMNVDSSIIPISKTRYMSSSSGPDVQIVVGAKTGYMKVATNRTKSCWREDIVANYEKIW